MLHPVEEPSVFDSQRWGVPAVAVADLANRLQRIWARYHDWFTTKTRDTRASALSYLRGLLTMDTDRNEANIARRVIDPDDAGQNLHQCMSDSPWPSAAVVQRIQAEIAARSDLHGGMRTLDERADERAGHQRAGAARPSWGRFGNVAMGQVGVALGYVHHGRWTLVDAELSLPEAWFAAEHAAVRQRWHSPAARVFATKPALGQELIRRANANGRPVGVVGCARL